MTHRGETFEHGYAQDVPFLLPKQPAPTTPQAWTATCAQGKCVVRVGERVVIETRGDAMRCVEGTPWLACLGKSDDRWLGWFVHRATGARVPFGVPWSAAVIGAPAWRATGLHFTLKGAGETRRVAPPG